MRNKELTNLLDALEKVMNYDMDGMATELGISKSLYEKVKSGHRGASKNFIKKLKGSFPFIDTNIFFTR